MYLVIKFKNGFKVSKKKYFLKLISLVLIFAVCFSCKLYKNPTTVNEALQNTDNGYFKVNMKNGDEVIFEKIEKIDSIIYGIKTIENNEIKTVLIENDILNIQKQNKKSSNSFKIIGITVGIGSVLLVFGMLN